MNTEPKHLASLLRPASLLCLAFLVLLPCSCDREKEKPVTEENLLASLNALEDVSATEITPQNRYTRQFAIDLTLPVDHENPDGQSFVQRMYLSHSSLTGPMVLNLSGYDGSARKVSELCDMLQANQLYIPHRGYREAEIEPMKWEHLNIGQAAADNHRIVELMKTIYQGEWISTGTSKGGMTALFLEYYFPEDADVVVAYVAPMISGYPDERVNAFVKAQGGDEVQAEIRKFQRTLLENRDSALFYFDEFAEQFEYTYMRVDPETALELGVMEYAVYLWQYRGGSSYYYKTEGLSIREMFRRWYELSSPRLYSDQYEKFSSLFYYQAFSEFGYYDLDEAPVADLLQKTGKDGLRLFIPGGVSPDPDFEKMDRIRLWLESQGEKILYIYGGLDPWTACQVNPGPELDALKLLEPDGTHGIRLRECYRKEQAYEKLEKWLETEVLRL